MDNNTAIYIAIAILVTFVVIQKIRNRKAPTMTVKEKINEGALVIDVRSPEEFATGAYPKAKNIPLDKIGSSIGKLPKDKPIVLYCASGARSGQAARMLKAAGFADVVSAGGFADMPR
jgi:phage shock protein E